MKVQPSAFSLLIFVLLLGISAVLLFAILRTPHVWTVDVGETDDTSFAEHFLKAQRTGDTSFRWSETGSRLMLHGVYAGPLALDLRLFGDKRVLGANWRLRLERDQHALATLEMAPGWRIYRVLLPAGTLTDTSVGAAPLELVSPMHSDAQDTRERGIPVDWVRVVPMERLPVPVVFPLLQALLLTWLLAVAGGALWYLDDIVWPHQSSTHAIVRVLILLVLMAGGLVVWAQHDPHTLAWALPVTPLSMGLATLVLIGLFWICDGPILSLTVHPDTRSLSNAQESGSDS